jgi:hypothetical protein
MANATILDREISVLLPSGTQLALLAREHGNLRRLMANPGAEGSGQKVASCLRNILNLLDRLIENDEDREFLNDAMMDGNLELDDLVPLLTEALKSEREPQKPAVRRARPKRA